MLTAGRFTFHRRILAGLLLLVVILLPRISAAQGSTAALSGEVRDSQSLAVPGATVGVTDLDTGLSRTQTTSGDGAFDFPGLLPGEYRLTVELAGFDRYERQVRLEVNQRVRADVQLRPAGVSQQVDVTQTVPLLHLSEAAVGEVIDVSRSPSCP